MSRHLGTETAFEQATIARLLLLGYTHVPGPEIERPPEEVVLVDVLRESLTQRYPTLPASALETAINRLRRPEGDTTLRRNQHFHVELLMRGFELRVDLPDGRIEIHHIHPIDWKRPEVNHFQVVNQLPITGRNDRRPDILIYVNGLPLVVFELKNPYAEKPSVDDALNQLEHYKIDVPQLFDFNALCVVSDGVETLHGVWSAGKEWYAPWKSIDGRHVEPGTTGSMKTLIEGLFPKDRLLAYLRHFILFEKDERGIVKKGAKYHQVFAVRLAVDKTLKAVAPGGDKRIGVIWHTTGSGKSLSMAFLVGILRDRPELRNPTFVIQVDRTDLDDQLHDQFLLARHLVGDVRHADSVEDLRDMLRTDSGGTVFTTVEKFALRRGPDGKPSEVTHPVLSDRDNIIIIADEAHRSQYGFLQGYARYLREALPNARRLGFTGTPVSLGGADTVDVFGDYIHTYDIRQAQEDRATVPIYYAARQARLHLKDADVDAALQEITSAAAEGEVVNLERRKSRWAALAAAAGAKDRLDALAKDLLEHFADRSTTLAGKGMIVCMTRENCVRLYDALTAIEGCPEVKIIMTGNLSQDPPEWNKAGHITTKARRDALKRRLIDVDDPLKLVIVCDMWLTGTDIPCLHTLYIDKPMRGHNMIQAISRVNRVFKDKPHGLIVDYIGIGDELRAATNRYTAGGGTGSPAPEVSEQGQELFDQCLREAREALPPDTDGGSWRHLDVIAFEDLHNAVYGWLAEVEERIEAFLQAELRVSHAFLLVKHLDECQIFADEIIFFQRVRKQLIKTLPGQKGSKSLEQAVRDLVDDHVESEGVVDIFKMVGIDTPDVSILDDHFLQTFKDQENANLRLKLLEKLLRDELHRRESRNIVQVKSFRALLEATLARYHQRIIDAASVVKEMVEIKKELDAGEARAKALNLADDELAFYDAIAQNYATVYEQPLLRDLVHDVVQSIKKNLKVDWTEPHRGDVRAAIQAAVKRVLRKKQIKPEHFDPVLDRVMAQAAALYGEWPMVG